MPHPAFLTDLVSRYETLSALHAEDRSAQTRQRLDDISYTLCIATGTRDIDSALTSARRYLADVSSEAASPALGA
ncbi:DUF5133 domain-containing protein [Streptomyces sp. NPDC018059]|uniref:DUF5133 domain-containing protein n=1 Tax=Streptomyces sp. NPDC018059 TaxID=3365041 RepID=UPI00378B7969